MKPSRRPPYPPRHPVSLIATWFGCGRLPWVPGTWGSLAALPFAAFIMWVGGPWALGIAAAAMFVVGVWASHTYARRLGVDDPGSVVVDEVAAQWMVLVPAALDMRLYLIGFVLFRTFDIAKTWPANWIDRRVKGGLGIMADDLVAALYAGAVVFVLSFWSGV
jgi:phosphatidylglycerophosphatase A